MLSFLSISTIILLNRKKTDKK
ncbi:hypothetical protein [Lactobacillus kefiranofaciens]